MKINLFCYPLVNLLNKVSFLLHAAHLLCMTKYASHFTGHLGSFFTVRSTVVTDDSIWAAFTMKKCRSVLIKQGKKHVKCKNNMHLTVAYQ